MLVIPARYNGPPESANGGYTCGLVAAYAGQPAEVTLRLPPPLDVPLGVRAENGSVEVRDGERLVAEARPAPAIDLVPPAVDPAAAAKAELDYAGLRDHPFPTCFVCGPRRPVGDGLGLRPGPAGDGLVAATWTPDAGLAGDGGVVRNEFTWAALDCPGAWALVQESDTPMVLGRLAARVDEPLRVGERYVVTGWESGRDGRKRYAGTAILDESGRAHAVATATWITLQQPAQ